MKETQCCHGNSMMTHGIVENNQEVGHGDMPGCQVELYYHSLF